MEFTEAFREALAHLNLGVREVAESVRIAARNIRTQPPPEYVTRWSSCSRSQISRLQQAELEPPDRYERDLFVAALELPGPLPPHLKRGLLLGDYSKPKIRASRERSRRTIADFLELVPTRGRIIGLYGPAGPRAATEPESLAMLYFVMAQRDCSMTFVFRPYSIAEWNVSVAADPSVNVEETCLRFGMLAALDAEEQSRMDPKERRALLADAGNVEKQLERLSRLARALPILAAPQQRVPDGFELMLSRISVVCGRPLQAATKLWMDLSTYFLVDTQPQSDDDGEDEAALRVDTATGVAERLKMPERLREFIIELMKQPEARRTVNLAALERMANERAFPLRLGKTKRSANKSGGSNDNR